MSDPTPAAPAAPAAMYDCTPAFAMYDRTPAVSDPDVEPEEPKEPEESVVPKKLEEPVVPKKLVLQVVWYCEHGVGCWDDGTCTQCAANPKPFVRDEPFELAPGQEKPCRRLANIACLLKPKRPLFTGRHTKP